MIYSMKLLVSGAPLLRKVCTPIDMEGKDIPYRQLTLTIINDMFELLNGQGIGLAAPQVGIAKRIIVIHVGGFKKAIINPEITKLYGGQTTQREGCLSFPGQEALIIRYRQIRVKGYDKNLKPVKYKVKGLVARCIQHEVDHLDGKCIF